MFQVIIPSTSTENLQSNTCKQVDQAICTNIEKELKCKQPKWRHKYLFPEARIHHHESYVSAEEAPTSQVSFNRFPRSTSLISWNLRTINSLQKWPRSPYWKCHNVLLRTPISISKGYSSQPKKAPSPPGASVMTCVSLKLAIRFS